MYSVFAARAGTHVTAETRIYSQLLLEMFNTFVFLLCLSLVEIIQSYFSIFGENNEKYSLNSIYLKLDHN